MADSEALRQRALQCGDDIARVASGLGYEVVAHTPTAFLKRNSTTAAPAGAASAAVTKPQVESHRFTAADGAPAPVVRSAAPPSPPPRMAVPSQLPPVLLAEGEDALDSCSSRSSSPGTEEQVGLVPVLSPLLQEDASPPPRRSSGETALWTYEVALPQALSAHESASRFSFTEASSHPLQEDDVSSWRDNNSATNNDDRSSPFGVMRANFPVARSDSVPNQQLPGSVNSLGERSIPSTTQSSPNVSPSPRQSVTPRRTTLGRHHGGTGSLVANNPNVFQVRATMRDVAAPRGSSNANTSVSMEHLNGLEFQMVGASQNTNRLLTPATDALNTPAVRVADDDIWPRLYGRPIQ